MKDLTPEDKELLRKATLGVLAARHPAALPPRAVQQRVAREVDFPFTEDDQESALAFLVGTDEAAFTVDEHGSTKYYRATSKGVLAVERG